MQRRLIVNAIDTVAELVAKVNKAIFTVCCAVLLVATVFTVFEAFMRYALNRPFSFGLELGAYFLLIVSLIPAAQVLLADKHIKIDILSRKFPAPLRRSLDAFSYVVAFGVGAVISWKGIDYVIAAFHGNWKSFSMSIPMWIPITAVPLTGILLSLASAARAWRAARARSVEVAPAPARTEG